MRNTSSLSSDNVPLTGYQSSFGWRTSIPKPFASRALETASESLAVIRSLNFTPLSIARYISSLTFPNQPNVSAEIETFLDALAITLTVRTSISSSVGNGSRRSSGLTPSRSSQYFGSNKDNNRVLLALRASRSLDISVLFKSCILATNCLGSEASSLLLLTRTIPFSTSSFTALSASRDEKLECANICSIVSPEGFSKREK